MKKSLIIFGILLITVLNVNSQISFTKDSKSVIIEEQKSLDLYNSVLNDFDNYNTKQTIQEEIQDSMMQDIYKDIYEENNLREQISKEIEKDNLYESLYASILNSIIKKNNK